MSALDEVLDIARHAQSDSTAVYCGITYGQVRAAVDRVRALEDVLASIAMAATLEDAKSLATGALST